MDHTSRLRIATRIHFALRRHFNEDVAVSTLLDNGADTREVLWVFDASGVPELIALAAQFRQACTAHARSLQNDGPGAAPQDTAWSRNTSGFGTSGFGISRPPEPDDAMSGPNASSAGAGPVSWLRRQAMRSMR